MGVWLDSGGEVMLTACSIQQGEVVEQATHVCSLHSGQNIFCHVVVKGLRVTLQRVKQAEGLVASFNILGGKTGRGEREGGYENKIKS